MMEMRFGTSKFGVTLTINHSDGTSDMFVAISTTKNKFVKNNFLVMSIILSYKLVFAHSLEGGRLLD